MKTPLLLDPDRLPRSTRFEWLAEQGELAATSFTLEAIHSASAKVPAEHLGDWRSAVARELLLLAQADPSKAAEIADGLFEPLHPFGPDGPAWPEVSGCKITSVLFPEVNASPSFGALWVVDQPGLAGRWQPTQGGEDIDSSKSCFCILSDATPGLSVGESWQLAAALATRALDEGDAALRLRLASQWVATGQMEPDLRVGWVRLHEEQHSKLKLQPNLGHRHWLLPAANRDENDFLLREFTTRMVGRLHWSATLQGAWAAVTGVATQEADKRDWPTGAHTVHAFASPAMGPVIASVLQCQPDLVVLWCTKVGLRYGQAARKVIQGCKVCEMHQAHVELIKGFPEDNIAEAERLLGAHPSMRAGDARSIVFNVTPGNLLMRMAARTMAELNPAVTLIYREERREDFTALHYPLGYGVTQRWTLVHARSELNLTGLVDVRLEASDEQLVLVKKLVIAADSTRLAEACRLSADVIPVNTKPFLIGSTFPWTLLRRKARVRTASRHALKQAMTKRPWRSFWGHSSSQPLVNEWLQADLTPETVRPSLNLDHDSLPVFDGVTYDECWIVSPDSAGPSERPPGGNEMPSSLITGWTVLCLTFTDHE